MSEQEVERCHEMGFSDEDINKVHTACEDLVSGDEIFFAATGVTSGDFLRGVSLYRRQHGYDSFCSNEIKERHYPFCRGYF